MVENIAKKCENKTCPKKKKRRGFFQMLFGSSPEKKKYPPEMCRIKYEQDCELDPDLSVFGGKAYKTCGKGAYVIQKDKLPLGEDITSKEELLIRKIEAPMGTKHEVEDPMPTFRSAEQRLLDLQDRKLHPAYKRYQGLRKKPPTKQEMELEKYTSINFAKLEAEELPKQIRINTKLLETKNIFAEFKRVEPPKQLLGKLLEMKKNEKPTLEKKATEICTKQKPTTKEETVFDTLKQKD